MFLGSRARPVRWADNLPPPVSRLSRQYGILNISQPYRPPWPVTRLALLSFAGTNNLYTKDPPPPVKNP
jgi:hypothetical protein